MRSLVTVVRRSVAIRPCVGPWLPVVRRSVAATPVVRRSTAVHPWVHRGLHLRGLPAASPSYTKWSIPEIDQSWTGMSFNGNGTGTPRMSKHRPNRDKVADKESLL